jgi:hypothetical protein
MIARGIGFGLLGAGLAATTLAIARRAPGERDQLAVDAEPVRTLPPVI